jgi:diguanylate cyclase (GGDEF)-like protein/PAS domain S-box-containing protein
VAGEADSIAARLLSTQRAFNAHLAALKPPEELVPAVIQTICETLDWSFGAFWVPSTKDPSVLEVRSIWHGSAPHLERFAEHCRDTRFRTGEGLLGTILETRQPAWLENLHATSLPRSDMAVPAELRAVFGFPVALGERFHGILEFTSEEERQPEPALIRDFHVVGTQLAQYLERWEAQATLARREEVARLVVDTLAEGVLVMDAEGRVTTFNAAAQRMLDFDPEHVRGHAGVVANADAMFLEDGTPLTHENSLTRRVLESGEPQQGVLVRAQRDGEDRWFEVNVLPLPGGGAVSSMADVTERRKAEEEQQRLAAIIASTDDAVLTKDRRQVITSWNAGAERLYGYKAAEVIGRTIDIIIPSDRRGEEREILDRVVHEEGIKRYETQRLRKDGTIVDVSLTASPVRDPAGAVVGASVIARNITKRKSAERALREERDRAERYLDMAHSIIVAIGRDERVTMINRTGLEILGRSEEEMMAANWFDLVLPEDVREDIRQGFRELMDGGPVDESGLNYNEAPVLTSSGERRTVAWMSTLLRDSHGRVQGLLTSGIDITERLKSEQAITHLAYHDQLTGLPNRTLLEEHLEIALARAARENRELALLYLDLDNFKLVNDSLGHAAGDRLLGLVAERLVGITRTTDLVARHGGDEFLLLLTDLEDDAVPVAEAVATKILAAFQEPFTLGDAVFEVGASVGVAIFPRDGGSTSALLRSADSAMYQAKAEGRNHYAIHRLDVRHQQDLLAMTARLRRALSLGQFVLHYQPIYTVPDRRLVAVEALIRWNDPARGLVGPGEFIQLAEDTGLIEPIGEWVIEAICNQAKEWDHEQLGVRIHFNLSPRQLRQRTAVDAIRQVIEDGNVAPDTLTAEITESAAMAEAEAGQLMLAELRGLGMHLSVDDFGSGYSSLGRLSQLPVDELKLDRSFLRGVPHDRDAGALVRGVIDLANGLGMTPVVEGVETAAQWEFLSAHGRLLAQGFHLARPAPAEEATMLLHSARQAA